MTTNNRRVAADARRIARDSGLTHRDQIATFRELLRRNYERGLEDGRQQERSENDALQPRTILLNISADILERMSARTEKIPNSDHACIAFREASANRRDEAEVGGELLA